MEELDPRPKYTYFTNSECEYFPCHKTGDPENFNCLFCFCPLYALGDGCGGGFTYTKEGIKNCSKCTIPHREGGYEYVTDRFDLVSELAKKNRRK